MFYIFIYFSILSSHLYLLISLVISCLLYMSAHEFVCVCSHVLYGGQKLILDVCIYLYALCGCLNNVSHRTWSTPTGQQISRMLLSLTHCSGITNMNHRYMLCVFLCSDRSSCPHTSLAITLPTNPSPCSHLCISLALLYHEFLDFMLSSKK